MAEYLDSVLMKDENAPIFATALLNQFPFYICSCMYVSSFLSHVLFIYYYKWFVNLLKRAPRKSGTANWVTLGK